MESDALTFAEKLLTLLDEGAFTTSYKFAVLLGLLDLSVELTDESEHTLTAITTLHLAEKVLEIYWRQTLPFQADKILLAGRSGQAEIVSSILKFQNLSEHAGQTLRECRMHDSITFNKLLEEIEWKLVELPLPRLQWFGSHEDKFIYEIAWNKEVTRSQFLSPSFRREIRFKPKVVDHFVTLNGLVRPLIQRKWSMFVAGANKEVVQDSQLEKFLFGSDRSSLTAVREPLLHLQKGTCLYCGHNISSDCHIDHFLPWSRWPSNLIENLVAAHDKCNLAKKDFFPAAPHIKSWSDRNSSQTQEIEAFTKQFGWESDYEKVWAAARGIYLHLPETTQLWISAREFEPLDRGVMRDTFRSI